MFVQYYGDMPSHPRWNFIFILLILSSAAAGQYYRVEVLFTEWNNAKSLIYNGKRCDVFTACDPLLYGYIDTQKPQQAFPGAARSLADFALITSQYNQDVLRMEHVLSKTVCGSLSQALPTEVMVRVDARDHDYLTANDIIDEFNCPFPFRPNARGESAWSEERNCTAKFHPNDIRLTYKWRILPIISEQCG